MKIRFSTLLKKHGPVKLASECSDAEWKAAARERRFATIYHGADFCTPHLGLIGHHGCVNTLKKIVFAKPVPDCVDTIIGLDRNEWWERFAD